MRAAALGRIERASFLAERALDDPDPTLRSEALDRIHDEGLLERIAERARRIDKQINQRARERVAALRIERKDESTVNARARELCERIEFLIHSPANEPELLAIAKQWSQVESSASPDLIRRYAEDCALLAASRRRAAAEPQASDSAAPHESMISSDASSSAVPGLADGSVEASAPASRDDGADADTTQQEAERTACEALAAKTRFDASVAAAEIAAERERDQRRQLVERVVHALGEFEQALDRGNAAPAHAAHRQLTDLREQCDAPLPRSALRRLAAAEHRYGEISRWQRWGDNQRRHQLCEEIRALPGTGLHPDAVATRVREAREEWSQLDLLEGVSAAQGARGLGQRFAALCRRALEPARPYFEKRHAIRQTHAQQITDLLDRIATLPADSEDWRVMSDLRHQAAAALSGLGDVDPRNRKTLARKIKTSLDRLDAALGAHHGAVENDKAALIAEARGLAARDSRSLVTATRELQRRWKAAGSGRRHRDQSQWKSFRAALDTAFAQLDVARAESEAQASEARSAALAQAAAAAAEAAAICAELESCAAAVEAPQRAQIAALETRWKALDLRDETLARRHREAQSALRDASARRARLARRERFVAWSQRYHLCRMAESGASEAESLRTRWAQTADSVAAALLTTRFDAALGEGPRPPQSTADETARDLLVQLETLAGIESPSEDRERRRARQLVRLSAHLRGEDQRGPAQQLEELLDAWSDLRLSDDASELEQRLDRALDKALDTLP